MLDVRQEQEEARTERSSGAARFWTGVLFATVLFLGGVGIGWLFTSSAPEQVAAPPITVTDNGDDSQTVPLLDAPSTDEPIADVAEALIPSIVQIELEGPVGGVGTGVIYSSDGRIMTAAHVVSGTDEVVIRMSDGERISGRVLGADSGNDIAVIEVERTNLPAAPLALDNKPRPGQLAIALGSPWGLDSTVTAGIVSAVDRTIPGENGPRSMIQTDAPINPGNSGGPLVDRHGRVIGINVSIFSASGANDGVGFAVPIDRAYRVAQALLAGGDFTPGFLGVTIQPGDDGQAGAVVTGVFPDTAAAEAGIRDGDIVIEVEGVSIADPADLAAQIRSHQVGDTITMIVVRDAAELELSVTLGERPN